MVANECDGVYLIDPLARPAVTSPWISLMNSRMCPVDSFHGLRSPSRSALSIWILLLYTRPGTFATASGPQAAVDAFSIAKMQSLLG